MPLRPICLLAALACSVLFAIGGSVRAQPPAAEGVPAEEPSRRKPLGEIVTALSRSSGISVVADKVLEREMASAPAGPVQHSGLEKALTELVTGLPRGTVWVKLSLPDGKKNRNYTGENLAEFALAQARLFGASGGPQPEGAIEVLGRKIEGAPAETVASLLELRPVYVLVNAELRAALLVPLPAPAQASDWAGMSQEQRQEFAREQARRILSADPQTQRLWMGMLVEQPRAIMGEILSSMTPEQRRAFWENMGGSFPGGVPGGERRTRPGQSGPGGG